MDDNMNPEAEEYNHYFQQLLEDEDDDEVPVQVQRRSNIVLPPLFDDDERWTDYSLDSPIINSTYHDKQTLNFKRSQRFAQRFQLDGDFPE